MKWIAMIALVLAVLARTAWHSTIELSFPMNTTTRQGFPINVIAFWLLLAIATAFVAISYVKKHS